MTRFNNLLSAIMDTDDMESESSCDQGTRSSASSVSTSSSKKLNQEQTIEQSPTNSNSNLDDNQLSSSMNSVTSSNEAELVSESLNSYESIITQEVEACLNQLVDDLVEREELNNIKKLNIILIDELIQKLEVKLNDLRAHYIELNDFYEQLQDYKSLMSKLKQSQTRNGSQTSLILDDLLQYFDFLDDDDSIDEKELLITLPDDFYLFLKNILTQCNSLVDDLNDLNKDSKLAQFESVIFDKLNQESLQLKDFYSIIFDLNDSKFLIQRILTKDSILTLRAQDTDESSKLHLWLKLTQDKLLFNITKIDLLSNLNIKNMSLANKLINRISSLNKLINIYQYNSILEFIDLVNDFDLSDTSNLIDKINIDNLFNNRVYSSAVLSFLIDESIQIGKKFLLSILKRFEMFNYFFKIN